MTTYTVEKNNCFGHSTEECPCTKRMVGLLFLKNVRKKCYSKISEITKKSQKSTSNFQFFFLDQGQNFGSKKKYKKM